MISKKIIKKMYDDRKKNKGIPIVAVVYDDNFNIKACESNKKFNKSYKENLNKIHMGHAEWIVSNELFPEGNIGMEKDLNIIITTSPCDKCAKRINKLYKNIFFLFEKFETSNDEKYKKYENIRKIDWSNEFLNDKETLKMIKTMEKHWEYANIQNKEKTLKRKSKESEVL